MADDGQQFNNPLSGLMNDAMDGLEGVFDTTTGGMRGLPLSVVANALFGANKNINVTLDWPWLEPHIMTRNERKIVPSIYMKEYEISENGLYSTINYYKMQKEENSKGANANPYKGLYAGKKTGMVFTFPYISSWAGGLSTEWDKAESMADRTGMPTDKMGMFGEAAGQAAEFAESAAKMTGMLSTMMTKLKNKNEVMILNPVIPKVWKGTQGEEINLVFYLFNTDSPPSVWIKNWTLITYLKMAVTFNQLNAMFATPPAIYTVTIPSIVHMSSAYISKYKVEQVGNCIFYDTTNGAGGGAGTGGVGAEQLGGGVGGGAEQLNTKGMIEALRTKLGGEGNTGLTKGEIIKLMSGDRSGLNNLSKEQLVNLRYYAMKNGLNGLAAASYDALMTQKYQSIGIGPKNLLIVPDAWKISITITELIDMSRQMIFHGLLKMGNYANVASITGAQGENPDNVIPPQLPADISRNGGPSAEEGAEDSNSNTESKDNFDGSAKPPPNAETLL